MLSASWCKLSLAALTPRNTLIIIIEDDSQDGADHVNSHRATDLLCWPLRQDARRREHPHSQPNVLRTIEDILGRSTST